MKLFLSITLGLICLSSLSQSIDNKVSPYLDTVVSQFPNVRDITLNSTNDEAIFSAQSVMGDVSVLISAKKIDDQWAAPKVVSFSGRYFDLEPFFSKDGLTLYFVSNRPLDQTSDTIKDFDIWYVERATLSSHWSKPINMGAPINTEMDEFYPSITDSRNLYFTLNDPQLKQKDDIYVSKFINGNYTQPKRLGNGINSDGYEFNAFVSKDESYMIYTCYNREDGYGSGDLYISTKMENGNWSPSKNMGPNINSDKMDYCPYVDASTKTLYFTSKRNSSKSTSETYTNLKELLKSFNSYENGSSRLYQVSLDGIITRKNP
jgi:hypothetical protein